MNIREREIILRLRSENPDVRSRQARDLFYGTEGDISLKEEIKKVVRFCFEGPKYAGMQKEIYDTLVSLVCEDILKASEDTIMGIQKSLKGYLFGIARNCANGKRDRIHTFLGINDKDESLDRDPIRPPVAEPSGEDGPQDFLVVLFYGSEDVEPGGISRKEMAKRLVERYINRVSSEKYRKILYAKDILKWSHARIERELGIDNPEQNHRRARLALTRVALPDIRRHCADFFRHHRDCVSPDEASLLEKFFDGATGLPAEDVSKAFTKLIKVNTRERSEFNRAKARRAKEDREALKSEKDKGKRPPKKNGE